MSTRRTTPALNPKKISRAGSSSQESLVEALLEGMGEGFFAFDHDWRFTAFNGAAEEIFGVPATRSLAERFGKSRPGSRGRNSTGAIAASWTSAPQRSSRPIRPCAPIGITKCVHFRSAVELGWHVAASLIGRKTAGRCATGNWSLLGFSGLAASAGWKSILRMAFAATVLRNISTFMAFPSARSTKRTSSGSSAFIRKTESVSKSTFCRRLQVQTKTTRPIIASFGRAMVKFGGSARSQRLSETVKAAL